MPTPSTQQCLHLITLHSPLASLLTCVFDDTTRVTLQIPYKVIEVNPLTKTELKWSSYKKVPVVQLDEEVLTGSSAIMSRVAAEAEASSSGSGGSQAAR